MGPPVRPHSNPHSHPPAPRTPITPTQKCDLGQAALRDVRCGGQHAAVEGLWQHDVLRVGTGGRAGAMGCGS
jgi:hypothetical protein